MKNKHLFTVWGEEMLWEKVSDVNNDQLGSDVENWDKRM